MIWAFIGKLLLKVLIQVLLKMVYSVASEQVISALIFKLLHALASKTKTEKDDEFVNKMEALYHSMSDKTDPEVQETVDKIKVLKSTNEQ